MPKYVSYDEMMEILDNKYLLPFRKDERLRGLRGIEIVRCGECKHRKSCCRPCYTSEDSYYSDAERSEE